MSAIEIGFLRSADSQFRPIPVGRGNFPISLVKATSDSLDCPVFGEQIDVIAGSPMKA